MTAKKYILSNRKYCIYILTLVGLFHYTTGYAQPDDVGGYISNRGKPGGSIDALKRLVNSDSINQGHLLQLGFLWENASQYDSAIWAFSRVLEFQGENSDALFGLARCFAASGRVKSAIASFNELMNRDSTNRLARLQFARLLKREGKYRDALSHLMKLSATDSTNSFLLEQIGDCGVKLGNPGLAISAYQQGYSYNPQNMPLATKYLQLAMQLQIPLELCQQIGYTALRFDSTYTPILRMLGYLEYTSQRFEEAMNLFTKAYNESDTSYLTLKYLGLSIFNYGKTFRSIRYLEKAFALDTTDKVLNFVFAKAMGETGDRMKALRVLRLNERLILPDSAELALVYTEMGNVHKYGVEMDQAIGFFQKAYGMNPKQIDLLYNLGQCYESVKNWEQAKECYSQYVKKYQQSKKQPDGKTLRSIEFAKERVTAIDEMLFFEDK